ncbi:MAG: hypothetical protein FWE53_05065 [Firmicutes bacterium]|nr:hypothetical protein [Bacillota bacterium]
MILNQSDLNRVIPADKLPTAVHVTVCLCIYAETKDKAGMVVYNCEPEWNQWYPFYDDKYKEKATCNVQPGETYGQLLERIGVLRQDKIPGRVNLAKMRFTERLGSDCTTEPFSTDYMVVEHKYSRTAEDWKLYVFYNYAVTSMSNTSRLLNCGRPGEIISALDNFDNYKGMPLVENMHEPYRHNLTQLKRNAIKV